MTRQEVVDEIVKRIKKAFPKSEVHYKNSRYEETTWIIVNEETYNDENYQLFITKLNFEFVYNYPIHSLYYISEK